MTAKTGEIACPFNYLYWDFLHRNRDKLANNARLGMMYRSLDKMDPERIAEIKTDAARFLQSLVSDAVPDRRSNDNEGEK